MKIPEGIKCVACPEPVEGLLWIYILLTHNGMLYVGQTHDVAKRLVRHEDGRGARQTRQLKEFALVYVEGPMDLGEATERERQLKKWSRADARLFPRSCSRRSGWQRSTP